MAASGITVDNEKFKKQVRELAKLTGRSVSQVMLQQVGIVGGSLIKAFPPSSENKTGTAKNDRRKGVRAIENDLKKIILPMHDLQVLKRWQDDFEHVHDVFDDTGSRIEEWHESHRDKRTGRTRYIGGSKYLSGRQYDNKLHVPKKKLDQYVRRKAKRVGDLKSGWLATAELNPKNSVPGWIKNGSRRGSYSDHMKARTGGGFIRFTNGTPYAGRWKALGEKVLKRNQKRFVKALQAEYRKSIKAANARQS